jgi:hypothetical protein
MSDNSPLYISILVSMRFDLEKKPMTRECQTQIEEYDKKLSKFSLPELEAEYQRAELVKFRFGKPEHALSEEELVKKGYYEENLSELSASELRARYESASEGETVKNLVEAHRFRALTPKLRTSYFGDPPEFVHWGALDYWTMGEATSLTMGLNPKLDLFSEMQETREDFAASSWSSRAAKARNDVELSRKMEKGVNVMGFVPTPMFGVCVELARA